MTQMQDKETGSGRAGGAVIALCASKAFRRLSSLGLMLDVVHRYRRSEATYPHTAMIIWRLIMQQEGIEYYIACASSNRQSRQIGASFIRTHTRSSASPALPQP